MKAYVPNLMSAALLIAAFLMYWRQDQLLALTSAIIALVLLGATSILKWCRARAEK
jgi:hypothetical protein